MELKRLDKKPDFPDRTGYRCDFKGMPKFRIQSSEYPRSCVRPKEPKHDIHYFFVRTNNGEFEQDIWFSWGGENDQ